MRDVLLQLYRQLLPFWDNNPNFRAKYANQPDVLKTLAYLKKLDNEAAPADAPLSAAAAILMPPLPIKSALLLQLKTKLEELKATVKTKEFEKKLAEKALEKFKNLKATADEIALAQEYLKNLQDQVLIYQQITAFQSADVEDAAFIATCQKEQPTIDKTAKKLSFLVSIQSHNLTDETSKQNFAVASQHLNTNLETWQEKTASLEAKFAAASNAKDKADIKVKLDAAKRGKETLEKLNTEIADLLNDPNYKIAIATTGFAPKNKQELVADVIKYKQYYKIIVGNNHPANIVELKAWVQKFDLFLRMNPSVSIDWQNIDPANIDPKFVNEGILFSSGQGLGVLIREDNDVLKVIAHKPANSTYLQGTIIHELVHAKQVKEGKLGYNINTGNPLPYLYDRTDELEAFEAEFYANGGTIYLSGRDTNLTSLSAIKKHIDADYAALPTTDNNADMTLQALGLSANVANFCKAKNLQQAYNPTTLEAMTLRQVLQGNTLPAQDLIRFKRHFKIGKIF